MNVLSQGHAELKAHTPHYSPAHSLSLVDTEVPPLAFLPYNRNLEVCKITARLGSCSPATAHASHFCSSVWQYFPLSQWLMPDALEWLPCFFGSHCQSLWTGAGTRHCVTSRSDGFLQCKHLSTLHPTARVRRSFPYSECLMSGMSCFQEPFHQPSAEGSFGSFFSVCVGFSPTGCLSACGADRLSVCVCMCVSVLKQYKDNY